MKKVHTVVIGRDKKTNEPYFEFFITENGFKQNEEICSCCYSELNTNKKRVKKLITLLMEDIEKQKTEIEASGIPDAGSLFKNNVLEFLDHEVCQIFINNIFIGSDKTVFDLKFKIRHTCIIPNYIPTDMIFNPDILINSNMTIKDFLDKTGFSINNKVKLNPQDKVFADMIEKAFNTIEQEIPTKVKGITKDFLKKFVDRAVEISNSNDTDKKEQLINLKKELIEKFKTDVLAKIKA